MPHYFYNKEVNTFTFANQPPASLNKGVVIYLSDIGINGSYWISNGEYWNAVNGEYVLKNTITPITTSGTTTEEIIEQAFLPAGLLMAGDILEYDLYLTKSGSVDTTIQRTKFGTSGTISDSNLLGMSLPATTSKSMRVIESFICIGTNTLRHTSTQGSSSFGNSSTAVSDLTSISFNNDNWISYVLLMTTGGIETNTLIKFILKHYTARS